MTAKVCMVLSWYEDRMVRSLVIKSTSLMGFITLLLSQVKSNQVIFIYKAQYHKSLICVTICTECTCSENGKASKKPLTGNKMKETSGRATTPEQPRVLCPDPQIQPTGAYHVFILMVNDVPCSEVLCFRPTQTPD